MISPDDPQLRNVGQTGGPALILYDGDCVLCSGWFRFVAQRDSERKVPVHPDPVALWPRARGDDTASIPTIRNPTPC